MAGLQTVLVVDDEKLVRWSLVRRLAQAGYRTLEAASAEEAMVLAQRGCDLLLLDLRLPDDDGLHFLQRLRNQCRDCPVILMSAFASPEKMAEAKAAGVFEVTSKPFDLETMLQLVGQALATGV